MGSSTSTPTDDCSRAGNPSAKSSSNEDGGIRPRGAGDANEDRRILDPGIRTAPCAPTTSTQEERAAEEPPPNSDLTGMALVNYQCRKPKRRYRKCMNDYYSREFMTGRSMEQDCHDTFEEYRKCVLRGIKSEIWDKQGLPPPKEGSPLADLDDS